jgi:hypothetical protein
MISDKYLNITSWVNNYGWIIIGSDDHYDSWIRIFSDGGLTTEINEGNSIDEALLILEKYFTKDFENEWG